MILKLEQITGQKAYALPNWYHDKNNPGEGDDNHAFLKDHRFKILYSGNIGNKQNWEAFERFCKDLDPSTYCVVIVGDGAYRGQLVKAIEHLPHVTFHPPVPLKELSGLLRSADLHVLFQKPEVVNTVLPSKILGMMGSGKPSLVIGNEESETRTIFEDSKGGLYRTEYNASVISDIDGLRDDESRCLLMGQNAKNYIENNYSMEVILSNFVSELSNWVEG